MCIPTTGAKQPQYTDLDQYIGVAFGDKLCSKYGIRSRLLSTVKHLFVVLSDNVTIRISFMILFTFYGKISCFFLYMVFSF